MAPIKPMQVAWLLTAAAVGAALVDCTNTPVNPAGPATTRAATGPGGRGAPNAGRGGGRGIPGGGTAGGGRGGRGNRGGFGGAGAAVAQYPFQDATLTVEERLADLLPRMTIEEKAAQMQMAAPAIDRLGIPAYHWWNEALHGVARNGEATVFPQAIAMAATWNTDLHHRMAKVIALEARAKHEEAVRLGIHAIYTGLDMWSPNINIFRDPRWGRGQETYGEDPYLTGRFGVAFVTGLQGDDPFYFQTIATPKHFAVHSGPEPERHRFDAEPSEVDLWTTYLPAFEAAVREGHAFSVMSSYNRVDGLPSSANPHLLTDILRKTWGFEGYVTSDVDAVSDVYRNHQTAQTPEEAAAISVKAGCDLNGGTTYHALSDAVKAGLLTEADLDKSLARLFTARFRLGLFDSASGGEGGPYAGTPYSMNDTKESDEVALDAARQSMVLLKNANNTLPLKRAALKSIAVIGPTADQLVTLQANYFGVPSHPVTLLQGIRNAMGLDGRVLFTAGCPLVPEMIPLEEPVPAAVLYTDATQKVHGLTADYYRDIAFAGNPIRTRIDGQIDFDWASQGAKDPITLSDGVSARWSGVIAAPQTGDYQLGLTGRDGFRMWVDGKLALDEWTTGNRRSSGASVHLDAGKPTAIIVEYFHPRGTAPGGGGGGGGGGRGSTTATAPASAPAPALGTPAATAVPPREEAGVQLMWTRPTLDGKASGGNGIPLFADAVRAAQGADAVVLVLGITADLEREEHLIRYQGFDGGDRSSLDLPAVQEKMLEEVTAAANGKPVVLVLTNGSALSINWASEHVPAIVEAWYPGQRGGDALADVLFGKVNPAGRLPITFYKSVKDLPAFTDYAMSNAPGRTYRYFTGEVLYPFGYGLSYSTFTYTNLHVSTQNPATSENVVVSATVTNTGAMAGDEVAQCYIDRPGGGPATAGAAPRKTLAGFMRVTLKPNEEKTVEFTVTPHQMTLVPEVASPKRTESAGPLTLRIGPNSAQGISQEINVTGAPATPPYLFVPPRVK